jgi:acetyltransferase-like isoleucine patch superfamily enzyme
VFFFVEYLPENGQIRPKYAKVLLYDYTFVYNCSAGVGINAVQIKVGSKVVIATSSFLHYPVSTLHMVNKIKYSSHHPVLLS